MIIYIGFDDTDTLDSDFGTGKVARWFEEYLPEGCKCRGVVRQQLLVSDDIPYTSHNSSACMIVEAPEDGGGNRLVKALAEIGSDYLTGRSADGSDPGLCVADASESSLNALAEYGKICTHRVSTQKQAMTAANGSFLAGLGGSNDGLIGAAAAVGLTASGWSGRYIEYGKLRKYPEIMRVSELIERGVDVISLDRDAKTPGPDDMVVTNNWVRPFRLGHKPVLIVAPMEDGRWVNIHAKRKKGHKSPKAA